MSTKIDTPESILRDTSSNHLTICITHLMYSLSQKSAGSLLGLSLPVLLCVLAQPWDISSGNHTSCSNSLPGRSMQLRIYSTTSYTSFTCPLGSIAWIVAVSSRHDSSWKSEVGRSPMYIQTFENVNIICYAIDSRWTFHAYLMRLLLLDPVSWVGDYVNTLEVKYVLFQRRNTWLHSTIHIENRILTSCNEDGWLLNLGAPEPLHVCMTWSEWKSCHRTEERNRYLVLGGSKRLCIHGSNSHSRCSRDIWTGAYVVY